MPYTLLCLGMKFFVMEGDVPTYRDFAAFGARAMVWRTLIVAQSNQSTGKANRAGFFSSPKNLIIIDSNLLRTRPFSFVHDGNPNSTNPLIRPP